MSDIPRCSPRPTSISSTAGIVESLANVELRDYLQPIAERYGLNSRANRGHVWAFFERPVDENLLNIIRAQRVAEPIEWCSHLRRCRSGRLHFDQEQILASGRNKEVDLKSLLIAEIVQRPLFAAVDLLLDEFGGHKPLEDGTKKRRTIQRLRGIDAKQMAEKSGINKIQLGRFDESLPEVFIERGNKMDLRCHFEDAQPLRYRWHRKAKGGCKIGTVENLSTPAGNKRKEPTKRGKISNAADIPDIAFQVGLNVRSVPNVCGARLGKYFGKTSHEQRYLRRLSGGKWEQREDGGASCHRLRYSLHQRCFLQAGDVSLSLHSGAFIDLRANIVEQFGRVLDFIAGVQADEAHAENHVGRSGRVRQYRGPQAERMSL